MSDPIYTADLRSAEWGDFEIAQISVNACELPIRLELPHTSLEGAAEDLDLVTVAKFLTAREARLLAAHLVEAAQAAEGALSTAASEYTQAGEAQMRQGIAECLPTLLRLARKYLRGSNGRSDGDALLDVAQHLAGTARISLTLDLSKTPEPDQATAVPS